MPSQCSTVNIDAAPANVAISPTVVSGPLSSRPSGYGVVRPGAPGRTSSALVHSRGGVTSGLLWSTKPARAVVNGGPLLTQ
jgi:hypothetical protein